MVVSALAAVTLVLLVPDVLDDSIAGGDDGALVFPVPPAPRLPVVMDDDRELQHILLRIAVAGCSSWFWVLFNRLHLLSTTEGWEAGALLAAAVAAGNIPAVFMVDTDWEDLE